MNTSNHGRAAGNSSTLNGFDQLAWTNIALPDGLYVTPAEPFGPSGLSTLLSSLLASLRRRFGFVGSAARAAETPEDDRSA